MFKNSTKTFFNRNLSNSQRFAAFSLVEVLITLAVIGIVASFTIPTLMNKMQNLQYVSALKKFYTTQENGWAQILANDGVQQLEDTSVFSPIPDECGPGDPDVEFSFNFEDGSFSSEPKSGCQNFYAGLQKYFKFTYVTTPNQYIVKWMNGNLWADISNKPAMSFLDGTIILPQSSSFNKTPQELSSDDLTTVKNAGGHLIEKQGIIMVDVNGFKKPNTWGKDIFYFLLSSDGKLYPMGGKDVSLFLIKNLSLTWQNQNDCASDENNTNLKTSAGGGCTARIMEDGWQMNY